MYQICSAGQKVIPRRFQDYRDNGDMVVNPKYGCYRKFVPHSFATTCYNTNGYDTFEIAFKIHGCVRENISIPRFADYEKWLKEDQGYS